MHKGLVRFFTVALIVISVFQISFTFFVQHHEQTKADEAAAWIKSTYPAPSDKYQQGTLEYTLYQDSLKTLEKNHYQQLLDESKDDIITYGLNGAISYQQAKESELSLGLDLQGGISVTLEIQYGELIASMALNPENPAFKQALDNAISKRYQEGTDIVDVFVQEYKALNPGVSLLSIFDLNRISDLDNAPSEDDLVRIIKNNVGVAIENTYNVLLKRIDQFGVAQPFINLDKDKGIITVELAGVSNLDRVRHYLQSSANLQFFELHTLQSIGQSLVNADKYVADALSTNKQNTTEQSGETKPSAQTTNSQEIDAMQALVESSSSTDSTPSVDLINQKNPLLSLLIQVQNEKRPEIGYIRAKDTARFNKYINMGVQFFPRHARFLYGLPIKNETSETFPLYVVKPNNQNKSPLEGKHIVNASQDFDPLNPSRVVVRMDMDIEGARKWEELTKKNVNKPIAIVLDNIVYTAPNVESVIRDGRSQISGNFTVQEGQDLSNILKAGKLPVSASIVQEQVVGPTLGKESVTKGAISFGVSFIVIFILMFIYYNTGGGIANIALILNLLFTVGVLSALGATLTAAGIAGLILTIGMAVDANVIIFERIKEELVGGSKSKMAIDRGYKRSLAPVLDSHITTLLTAVILYSFGLGPVKGFATTQILGILLSLFCGILFSRLLTDWWAKKERKLSFFTPLSRSLFRKADFKFIENRNYAYIVSAIVVIVGISSFFNGFNQGVEFAGGRSFTVDFEKPVPPETLRASLKTTLNGELPVIKTLGGGNKVNITTSYLITQNGKMYDDSVLSLIFQAVRQQIPSTTQSYEAFKENHVIASSKVLPSISEDLKSGARWATFWSLLLIAIYIFIRFRDWRYSLGTIFALFHDVLVMLAVFSFAKDLVPFSLEIDQHFIAAILTVIGFSMNDTIIVFDRIREYSRLMPSADRAIIINKAVNNTLSRTIMTSLTVLLTILILFLLGGDVTKGFAFAMLIGVLTGTYSSIFVAAPILIDMRKKKDK